MNSYSAGVLRAICEHLAIEQTGFRLDDVNGVTREKVAEISSIIQPYIASILDLTQCNESMNGITEYLREHCGANVPKDDLEKSLPYLVGYCVGTVAAGYTPVLIQTQKYGLGLYTGELWYVELLLCEEGDDNGETLLTVVAEDWQGRQAAIRWITDDTVRSGYCEIIGLPVPVGTSIPLLDLEDLRAECKATTLH